MSQPKKCRLRVPIHASDGNDESGRMRCSVPLRDFHALHFQRPPFLHWPEHYACRYLRESSPASGAISAILEIVRTRALRAPDDAKRVAELRFANASAVRAGGLCRTRDAVALWPPAVL